MESYEETYNGFACEFLFGGGECRVQILKTKLVVSLGNSKQNLKNRVVKDFMMS